MDPIEIAAAEEGAQERHAALLEYDFLKHLTSVALTAIGAVVALAGSVFQNAPDRDNLWLSAGFFVIGAILAFAAQDHIVSDAKRGRPTRRWVTWMRRLAVTSIGVGAGVVLSFSYAALK